MKYALEYYDQQQNTFVCKLDIHAREVKYTKAKYRKNYSHNVQLIDKKLQKSTHWNRKDVLHVATSQVKGEGKWRFAMSHETEGKIPTKIEREKYEAIQLLRIYFSLFNKMIHYNFFVDENLNNSSCLSYIFLLYVHSNEFISGQDQIVASG